jgi:hypothetical protein
MTTMVTKTPSSILYTTESNWNKLLSNTNGTLGQITPIRLFSTSMSTSSSTHNLQNQIYMPKINIKSIIPPNITEESVESTYNIPRQQSTKLFNIDIYLVKYICNRLHQQELHRYNFYRQQLRQSCDSKQAELKARSMSTVFLTSQSIINLFTNLNKDNSCSICHDDIDIKDNVWMKDQCQHLFHESCISGWISEYDRQDCPMCRTHGKNITFITKL